MKKVLFAMIGIGLLVACKQIDKLSPYTEEEKEQINTVAQHTREPDSLQILIKQYEKTNHTYGLAVTYKRLGKILREEAKFSEALTAHRKGLAFAVALRDTNEITQAFNNIGTDFRRMGMLSEAANAHYQAVDVSNCFSGRNSKEGRKNYVIALNGIGNIHKTLDNREEAETYFRRALVIEQENKNALGQAINWANLGSIYKYKEQYDSALVYYQRSLMFNEKAKSKLGVALCHTHFGQIYECVERYDKAFEEYQISYNLLKTIPDKWNWLKSCTSLAGIYLRNNNYEQACKILDESLKIAQEIHSFGHLCTIHLLYSQYYEQRGDYRQALKQEKLCLAYNDSLLNVQDESNVYETRVRYEREQQTRKVEELTEQKEREARNNHILLVGSAIVLLLLLLVIGVLIYAHHMRLVSSRAIKRMERMRSTFFTNITHEFRTPLTVILGLVEQMQNHPVTEENTKRYYASIHRQGTSLLDLVNQLLDISKLMTQPNPKQWLHGDVVAYIRMVLEGYREYAGTRCINLIYTPETIIIKMDFVPEYLNKILRNLLSNALKYTPRNGIIQIILRQQNNKLVLIVSDTGEGIPPEDLPHIFDIFYQGSNNSEQLGTGIGLPFVRQMVESMGGTISAANKKEGGAFLLYSCP